MTDTKPTKKHEAELKEEIKIDKSPELKTNIEEKKEGETKTQEKKKETKVKEIPTHNSVPSKKGTSKEVPASLGIKDVAIANGFSLKISPKQSKFVCRIIRGKSPENAVKRLQDVIDEKRPVPMAGLEVGHRKGKGLAGGKFPKNACKGIMEIVKQAGANAVVAGIENPVIIIAKSDRASAPYRKAGRKAKRAHIHIEIKNRVVKK